MSTEATIVRKRAHSARTGRHYWLLYVYAVNRLEYERQERVSRSIYYGVGVGEKVKIIYLSSNPQEARIVDTRVKG